MLCVGVMSVSWEKYINAILLPKPPEAYHSVTKWQITKASLQVCVRAWCIVCLSWVRLCGLNWGEANGGVRWGEYRSCWKHAAKWTADAALLQANESAALAWATQKSVNGLRPLCDTTDSLSASREGKQFTRVWPHFFQNVKQKVAATLQMVWVYLCITLKEKDRRKQHLNIL